jgi:hypothetical protein
LSPESVSVSVSGSQSLSLSKPPSANRPDWYGMAGRVRVTRAPHAHGDSLSTDLAHGAGPVAGSAILDRRSMLPGRRFTIHAPGLARSARKRHWRTPDRWTSRSFSSWPSCGMLRRSMDARASGIWPEPSRPGPSIGLPSRGGTEIRDRSKQPGPLSDEKMVHPRK